MPVIGHAFVGWATAAVVRRPHGRTPARDAVSRTWWIPMMVVLAYLPDFGVYALQLCGISAESARHLCHGAWFAAGAGAAASVVARAAGAGPWRALSITTISIWLHDLADMLQGAQGTNWWPLPLVNALAAVLPDTLATEAAVFGPAAVAIVTATALWRKSAASGYQGWVNFAPAGVAGWTALLSLLALAATTSSMRDARELDVAQAVEAVAERRFAEALQLIDQAEGWPYSAKPGRLDYLRAESYAGLGDDARAERYYQKARLADPGYFWATADLAVFYAGSHGSEAERRAKVEPLVAILVERFAGHTALPRVMSRIDRRLGEPISRRGP